MSILTKSRRSLAALAIAGCVALPTQALSCGYNNCWGAVAIGPGTLWGWAAGHATEQDALNRIYSECPGCDNVYSFVNTCGAMARGDGGGWGSGWGDTRLIAEDFALDTCYGYTNNCSVAVWACSQ